jgi:hypothetical protein
MPIANYRKVREDRIPAIEPDAAWRGIKFG